MHLLLCIWLTVTVPIGLMIRIKDGREGFWTLKDCFANFQMAAYSLIMFSFFLPAIVFVGLGEILLYFIEFIGHVFSVILTICTLAFVAEFPDER